MADASVCPCCGEELPPGKACGCRPTLVATVEVPSVLSGSVPTGAPGETVDHSPLTMPDDATGDWSDVPGGETKDAPKPAPIPRAVAAFQAGTSVSYFGDYELVRELGRGGMGVVYEARQVSLNRAVALKLIKAGLLADDHELRRFRNEAEAVAMLDHPGIVSAYEVGEHDGQQYLAMKLVRGPSLSSLLDRYGKDARAAASLVAEAAEAVAHAHSRGILHRDLKPANILVDADGHPHITDFGLARRIEDDLEMTATGAILGTPAYMAPEQAGGHRSAITTATDVYGLGSVLYALLSGRPPFKGDSILETLDALRGRPPEPPSRLNAKVPRDLETICLKCLEKDPKRRYASAQALADDLRAWLGNRPISARRVGVVERSWLWCKRRPAVAALAAAVVLAMVGGVAVVLAVQAKANRDLLAKNRELTLAGRREAAANARVEQRYRLAMDAIETFHTGVSEDFLLKEPKFRALRERLLTSARGFYEKLGEAMEEGDDPASRRAVLASNYALAELINKVGRPDEALALFRRVMEAREAIAARPGADLTARLDAAEAQRATVKMLEGMQKWSDLAALLGRAVPYHEALVSEFPANPEVRHALAEVLVHQGHHLKERGKDRAGAEKALDRSLEIAKALAREHPREVTYLTDQTRALNELSGLRAEEGKFTESTRVHEEILRLMRRQSELKPDDVKLVADLASAQVAMCNWLRSLGKPEEAMGPARDGLRTWETLVRAQPAVPVFRRGLASSHYALGLTLGLGEHYEEAVAELRKAQASFESLAAEPDADRSLRTVTANTHNAVGSYLMSLNRLGEAEAEVRKALAIQKALLDEDPSDHDMGDNVGISHLNLGRLLTGSNPGLAEREFREAIAQFGRIAAEQPALAMYPQRKAATHQYLSNLLLEQDRVSEALAEIDAALAIQQAAVRIDPDNRSLRNTIASTHSNLGDTLRQRGRAAEALARYERAVAIREQVVADDPKTPMFRSHLAWSLRRRGLARRELGDPAGAVSDARRALALHDALADRSPIEWFETACAHAALSGLAGLPGSGLSAGAAIQESDQALRLLALAIGRGFRDARLLDDEPALEPLRPRPEFRMLLQDLAFPADAFAR